MSATCKSATDLFTKTPLSITRTLPTFSVKKIFPSPKVKAHGFCKFAATICTASVPVGLVFGFVIIIEPDGDDMITIEAALAAIIEMILVFLSIGMSLRKLYYLYFNF